VEGGGVMLEEKDKWELARKFGPLTKSACEPLVSALAGLLQAQEVLGCCFLIECADNVLKTAAQRIEEIQQARGYYCETVQ